MRLRWPRIAGTYALLALGLTVLSACAGVPPSFAGVLGGLGGGLGVGLLVLLLSATQPACSDDQSCLSRDACLSLRDSGSGTCLSGLRDGGPFDATPSCLSLDGGPPDSGQDAGSDAGPTDSGPRDAAPCLRDAAQLDVGRHFGAPEPEYLARVSDERRAVIDDLRRRGVLTAEIADDLEGA